MIQIIVDFFVILELGMYAVKTALLLFPFIDQFNVPGGK